MSAKNSSAENNAAEKSISISPEILSLIDSIAKMLAPYFVFGYFEREDIEQEIRMFCLDALPRYNEAKSSLRTFLIVHSKNRLISLKRDKLCRIFPPCVTCKHKEADTDICTKYNNKDGCKSYSHWNMVTMAKYNIVGMSELQSEDISYSTDLIEELSNADLLQYIDEHIPTKYRDDYLRFMENGKMTAYAKQKIIGLVRSLAKDYLNSPDTL